MSQTNTIRWPDWLPRPQQNSYNYQPEDRRRKSDMEIGSVYRKEFDTDVTKCSCTLWLNELQSDFFEAFERDVLEQGAKWFEFPLLVGGQIEYHLVRFAERPKMNALIGKSDYEYSLSLTLSKRMIMNEELVKFLLAYPPDFIMNVSNKLHDVLHVQIPGTLDIPQI